MNKFNMYKFANSVKKELVKHSPEILTGMGIAGMITTTILAVKGTPKALHLIEEEKRKTKNDSLTAIDMVKTTWKCYIPAAISGAVSIACLIGASSVSAGRNAALATAYSLSETALKEYQDKVVEVVGEKKEQLVRDEIAKDQMTKNPVTNNEVFITSKGTTLCYDKISGRYFKSDIEDIKKAVNELNRRMLDEMSISLNEFYYEIGLDGIDIGEELGWNVSRGFIDISYSSVLAADGTPCLSIDHREMPKAGFSEY